MQLKIRELREEFQMTQKELAEKLSSAQRNVSNWENGVNEPDLDTVVKLCEIFHVGLEELFGVKPDGDITAADRELLSKIKKLTPSQSAALSVFLDTLITK